VTPACKRVKPFAPRRGLVAFGEDLAIDPGEHTGWALFDKNDPTKVLARANAPVFAPTLEWEKVGQVPNVVFVEGLVREPNRWLYYYGGADKYIGVASTPVASAASC